MIAYRHLWFVCLLVCFSCDNTKPSYSWEQVPVGDLYTIELPDLLVPGYDMHDYAGLQYYSLEDNLYVLGIEDAKENLGEIKRKRLKLKGYFSFVEQTVLQPVDTFKRESTETISLSDDSRALIKDYYANSKLFGWNPLFYRIGVYENPDYFVQLVIWLPYEDHCEIMPMLDSITQSIKFLPTLE
ncbi:MAG: hypothetical protein AAFY71_16130 [Bacteroidota bacterium]